MGYRKLLIFIFLFVSIILSTLSQNIQKYPKKQSIFEKLCGSCIYLYYLESDSDFTTAHQSDSISQMLVISKDSTYKIFIDGKLRYKFKFYIVDDKRIVQKGRKFGTESIFLISKDTLYIDDICYDCGRSVYIRKK